MAGLRDNQFLAGMNHIGVADFVLVVLEDGGPVLCVAVDLLGDRAERIARTT
jgi:hypothetical protein